MDQCFRKVRVSLLLTAVFFAVSAAPLSAIPFLQKAPEDVERVLSYLIGALFWIGLFGGLVCVFQTSRSTCRIRRKAYRKIKSAHPRFPGVLNLSLSVSHMIIYAVTLLGLAAVVTDIIFHYISVYIMFPILSLTYFAFVLHCIVDGKNYIIYKFAEEGINNGDEQ